MNHIKITTQIIREEEARKFSSDSEAKNLWEDTIGKENIFDDQKEFLVVYCLDVKLNVKCWNLVSIGDMTSTTANIREVLKPAIVSSCSGIVLMHNHPSGDTTPSRADINFTKKLNDACGIMNLALHDHIVIGDDIYSFQYHNRL